MYNRKELKARGLAAFKANYWRCVLAFLIAVAIILVPSMCGGFIGGSVATNPKAVSALMDGDVLAFYGVLLPRLSIYMLVVFLISIFAITPVFIGIDRFYLVNSYTPADMNEIAGGFKPAYGRNILAMVLETLIVSVASIILPLGIILSYSYSMVPYILADDPEVSAVDALKRSREMMKGYKWKLFVLELSFIGWAILSGFTFHLLGIFFVFPYMIAAETEFYRFVKGDSPLCAQPYGGAGYDPYGGQYAAPGTYAQNTYSQPAQQPVYQQPAPTADVYGQPEVQQPVDQQPPADTPTEQ